MKEIAMEEQQKANEEITMQEEQEMYAEARNHKTHLADHNFDPIPFTVDFSKVQGVGKAKSREYCTVMLSGNLVVINTPYDVAMSLWALTK